MQEPPEEEAAEGHSAPSPLQTALVQSVLRTCTAEPTKHVAIHATGSRD